MQTVGFVGVGKIGLPISENLIKSGFRVLGYRRSSLADFEKIGGVPAKSPADIGAQCDVVLSCVPTTEAMNEVVNGPQTVSFIPPSPDRSSSSSARIRCRTSRSTSRPLAQKGAAYIDGEVSGTPGMVAARKAVIYLAGDADACKKLEPVIKGFADMCLYLRAVRRGDQRQARSTTCWLPSTSPPPPKRWRSGVKAGVDLDLDDQGDRQRQRRIDPVRHPRAVDGGAQVQADPGLTGAARALFRQDRETWRTPAAARRRCSTAPPSSIRSCADIGLADDNDVAVMVDVHQFHAEEEIHDPKRHPADDPREEDRARDL